MSEPAIHAASWLVAPRDLVIIASFVNMENEAAMKYGRSWFSWMNRTGCRHVCCRHCSRER
jgi:hypothetical protein